MRVLIKCPKTGRWVETGVDIDIESYNRSPIDKWSIKCSICGQKHIYSKTDTRLENGN